MKHAKYIIVAITLLFFLSSAAAIPEMPHHVYGDITDLDGPEDNINVSFYHNSNFVKSTTTDSNGYYDIKIPYDSNYDGEELSIYTEDIETGKRITFSQGASEEINYEDRNIIQDSFSVSGTITKDSNGVNSVSVKFYNDGNSISSTTTDSNGDYSVDIPFSDGYDGENLNLYVNGSDTGETTTFVTRSSDTLDYTISSDSTSTSTNEDTTEESTNDQTEETNTTTTDSDNTDSNDDSSSDSSSEGAVVEITDLSSSPQDPSVGQTVQIYVTVTNTGDLATDHEVSINVGGETLKKTVENLEAGDTELLTFEKQFDAEESYAISVGGQSHSINVGASQSEESAEEEVDEEDGGLGFIQIMGIVGGLLMLIVVIYLFVDSRRNGEIDEEQKGALDAFKEKKRKEKEDDDGFGWKYANDDD